MDSREHLKERKLREFPVFFVNRDRVSIDADALRRAIGEQVRRNAI